MFARMSHYFFDSKFLEGKLTLQQNQTGSYAF